MAMASNSICRMPNTKVYDKKMTPIFDAKAMCRCFIEFIGVTKRKEGNVLFNDALNTFYLRL